MAMQQIWDNLKNIKGKLKGVHKQCYANLETRIAQIIEQLDVIQTNIATNRTEDLFVHEAEYVIQLKKLLVIEESAYRQKSRIQWLNLGVKLTTAIDIQVEVMHFETGLLGTATQELPGVDIALVRAGAQVQHADVRYLIQPVTHDEIDLALHNIDQIKALGIDGFNSLFFKRSWHI
ncbi:uncharacterized protein LOC125498606 [Beta vulgaris subsp. vulgaris]|uniref:uncharacterized protein LOC125498606 n=1 Tax=Beta vulgaris subsp. vulgaris TaxID=3555 RepID=UPI0020371B6D|nr:uncharacterized protein LOC125498606 [Beta vulgaris subsp. vulgaris]